MKKNTLNKELYKLLKAYIEKYNGMKADLEIDEKLGCEIRYDKGKIYQLCDVIYDLATLLNVTVNMDINGIITIAE